MFWAWKSAHPTRRATTRGRKRPALPSSQRLKTRASVFVTTNLSFGERVAAFGDAKMTTALFDWPSRLCRILELGNDRFPFKHSSAGASELAKEKSRNLTPA
jgi:hypothetical protein